MAHVGSFGARAAVLPGQGLVGPQRPGEGEVAAKVHQAEPGWERL